MTELDLRTRCRCGIWTGNDDPPEFHEAKLCIIEKKGDLRLPKNYRPICLLDVASKVISVIIADRCQSVLKMHGLDKQNGSLKLALHSRKEFGLDKWAVFVDLVKALETVNQDILMKMLSHYEIHNSFISVIKCLYQYVNLKPTWGKNKHAFPSLFGVKRGDNLAPILCLFVIHAAM